MMDRYSDNDASRRDIPSFIEPRPPLIQNPFMRPRPQKGVNLLDQFEEDSEIEEPELVQVYLRMKPCGGPNNLYEVRSDKCLVTSLDTTTAGHGRRTQHNVSRMYTFSRIFKSDCSQKEIFEEVVKDNLKKLPDGHSFTLLTYGASGSGKTYTLMGTVTSPGLVPRSLEYVFKLVDAAQMPTFKPSDTGADQLGYAQQDFELQWVKRLRHVSAPLREKYRRMSAQLCSDLTVSNIDLSNRTKYYVWVSFVEIYNEAIYDLLAPPDKRVKMRIREDSSGNVYVKGVTHAFVRSGEEAYDVMVAGKHNLIVAATGIHAQSSRSHCIFTITMLTESEGSVRASHVRLCDLAGSERQRAARNCGARMQESRAINSSLHVLERCLHMLRRRQRHSRDAAMVPYRESKLTRLLGSGLSGSRGEAVSMVVTLNPAPQYAHETKHVLSLAAVAQDIQINNTMFASTLSTLESSTQDTTICTSAEVMKLRADNERLHFELVQAQARNKDLLASMEETQQQTANTMRELVEETKDMMRQYYEAQLTSLKTEMDDMIEEYESRLAKHAEPPTNSGTPSRYLQTKIAQLMTEITVLEDKLSEEKLARARAEKEVQHLRDCIEERDEKAFREAGTETQEVVLTDSDHKSDDESDLLNESLEPVFKKECSNRSHILHKNELSKHEPSEIVVEESDVTVEETTVNEVEYYDDKNKSIDTPIRTLKHDNSVVATKDSLYLGDDECEIVGENKKFESARDSMECFTQTIDNVNDKEINNTVDKTNSSVISYMNDTNADKDKSECEELFHESTKLHDETQHNIKNNVAPPKLRGTYFIKNYETPKDYFKDDLKANFIKNEESPEDCFKDYKAKNRNSARVSYFVDEPALNSDYRVDTENKLSTNEFTKPKKISETLVNEIIKTLNICETSDNSLRQFEQLEIAAENVDNSKDKRAEAELSLKFLKMKRTYFSDTAKDLSKTTAVIHNHIEESPKAEKSNDKKQERSTNIKDKTDKDKIYHLSCAAEIQENQLFFDCQESALDPILSANKSQEYKYFEDKNFTDNIHHINSAAKTQENELFFATHEIINPLPIDGSKKQEKPKYFEDSTDENKLSRLSRATKIQEKQLYFDDNDKTISNDVLISSCSTKKRTYFDNIDGNVNPITDKQVNNIVIHSLKDQDRSPSIVKDVVGKDYEPSTAMKKIDILCCIQKNQIVFKKHKSVDFFESPQIVTAKAKDIAGNIEFIPKVKTEKREDDNIAMTSFTKEIKTSNVEVVHKSIESLDLDKKAKEKVEIEIKLGLTSSIEEPVSECIQESVICSKQCPEINIVQSEQALNETKASKENNTIDEFENIYKDLTNTRATEFELLVSQETNTSNLKDKTSEQESDASANLKEKHEIETSEQTRKFEEAKYNLRNKGKSIHKNVSDHKKENEIEEIIAESYSKCESKTRTTTKRNLRLRRRKNLEDEISDPDNERKLKDIINLKNEFSDVTMGLPTMNKEVKDIPSPEKLPGEAENLPPMLGIQSCPSKSVTRSRRKLFTPRAEPLEESLTQTGDSNERLYVPRPSYHRVRARRKL